MGFQEKILPESTENITEDFPRVSEGMVANMVQISLMPLAFKARHPEISVDMKDPNFAEKGKVIEEWMEQDAKLFRAFISANPDRTIDLSSEDDLSALLQEVWDSETRH